MDIDLYLITNGKILLRKPGAFTTNNSVCTTLQNLELFTFFLLSYCSLESMLLALRVPYLRPFSNSGLL